MEEERQEREGKREPQDGGELGQPEGGQVSTPIHRHIVRMRHAGSVGPTPSLNPRVSTKRQEPPRRSCRSPMQRFWAPNSFGLAECPTGTAGGGHGSSCSRPPLPSSSR